MASMIRDPEKLQALLSQVRAFVRERWHPIENEVEQLDVVPDAVVDELRRHGFLVGAFPRPMADWA